MKKRFVTSLALAVMGTAMMAGSAMAVSLPITLGDIASFDNLYESSPTTETALFSVTSNPDNVKFVGDIKDSNSGFDYMLIGGGYLYNASAGDTFDLLISNVNENPWKFMVWVDDDNNVSNGVTMSSWMNIPSSLSTYYHVSLSFGSSINITSLGFGVGGDTPLGSPADDYTFEAKVKPVPEPATMLLFGSGLVGLAGAARRRLAKKA